MPTISAGCLSILQLFVLSTTDIIINIAHEYILHISLQKKTMWCSLLFLSQDKKMNRQSTDFPLLSTVYKMYTYMHVLTSVSSYMALYYPVSIFSMVWIIMRTELKFKPNICYKLWKKVFPTGIKALPAWWKHKEKWQHFPENDYNDNEKIQCSFQYTWKLNSKCIEFT